MPSFWSYISGENYSVGCTGQTVYIYDKNHKELARFRDIQYGYTPVISPDERIVVIKSTDGRLAVYSLEGLKLVKKFRFSKVNYAQDDGCCFSGDGKQFVNIERHKDDLHCAVTIYDTYDFSVKSQQMLDDKMMLNHIEYDSTQECFFVLGVKKDYFVSKFENNRITKSVKISENEFEFYRKYKRLELMGFTEKAFVWSYMDCELSDIIDKDFRLSKLFDYYNK